MSCRLYALDGLMRCCNGQEVVRSRPEADASVWRGRRRRRRFRAGEVSAKKPINYLAGIRQKTKLETTASYERFEEQCTADTREPFSAVEPSRSPKRGKFHDV